MKKENSKFKTKGIVAKALALVMLITCIAIPVLGNTESKDGIEVTLETDKDSYSANEEVKISVSVKNTGETALNNVTVELRLPDGVKIAEGSDTKITFDVLGKGETKEQTVLSKAGGAADKKDIIVDGSVQTGDGTKNIILGLVICEIIAAVIVIVLKNKKLRKGIAMLSVTIVFVSAFTMVAYAVMQFEISKEIEVGGVKKEIIAVVSYDKNEENDNIKPSPDDKETAEKETTGGENESTKTETDKPGNDEAEETGVKWEILNGDTLHIYGEGEMEDYNVPWREQRENIKKVVIGEGVTSIGAYAFGGCSSLTDIEIPNSVTEIGAYAFEGCSSLKDIEISNNITKIGEYAFYGTEWLSLKQAENSLVIVNNILIDGTTAVSENIKIPDGVISIGDRAFGNCSSLTNIEIPNSVTSIGEYAFSDCSSLKIIKIPNSVTNIGGRAFDGTKWLSSKQAEDPLVIVNNILIDGSTATGDIEIPDGVTSIGNYAFYERWGCGITGIKISDSVTSIGDGSFSMCDILTNIEIPNSVKSIGGRAFIWCQSLTNIEIPNSVTSIGGGAFAYCQSLANIVIPNSVTSINGWFAFCSSLSSVEIPSSVTSINGFGEGNWIETIYGTKGSYSETYAKENGYIFMEK